MDSEDIQQQEIKPGTMGNVPIDDPLPLPNAKPELVPQNMQCGHKMNGRNLVVCIDGTSNQFGEKNTNVIEMYNLILKGVHDRQRTWYNSGIGSYTRPSWKSLRFYKQVLYHKIDLAIAWDLERTILGAYRWLSENYEEGDCIFLFGFSRGAYQVRVLSAMIDKVGLIYKGNEAQIPFAYELYADPRSDGSTVTQVGSQQKISMAERFKHSFSRNNVKVHFLGAWDTVSSLGIARGKHMLPRTIDGMKHVCYFRHALALDERRVKFLPEYAYGGYATPEKDNTLPPVNPDDPVVDIPPVTNDGATRSTVMYPQTKEVWFAGTHLDVGGGNVQNIGMDRSRPPLRWMAFEAGAVGLRTAPFLRELSSNEQIEIRESLTWLWWYFEIFPFKRMTFTRHVNGKQITHKPHFGSGRKIHRGQKIHSSVLLNNGHYIPKARPVDDEGSFWQTLGRGTANDSEWLELDFFEYTRIVVEMFIAGPQDTAALRQIATFSDGRRAVYESVVEALRKKRELDLNAEVKYQLLSSAVDILGKTSQDDPAFKLSPSIAIRPFVSDLWKSGNKEYQKTAHEFMLRLTDPCLLVLQGHKGLVRSVAFSPDSKQVVSGAQDETVRIWDTETGQPVGEPFRGHTDEVMSVAFSLDSSRIVSGSGDKTVRVWDVKTGKSLGEPFRGHTDLVRCVAYSFDGKRVVSGSDDKTVRIWDVETGKPVGEPFQGHTNEVTSVAFSSRGEYVVSGSVDKTVRIWEAKTGKPVGEPFREHRDWVNSVAFSSDDKRVISGSRDKKVKTWDIETRELS